MNYATVQDVIDAGTTNATVIRNNVKNDDGTDTLTGVDWFTFNGTVASNVYVSGNTWFGFGSSSEHLKVDRRDAASFYVYREEGTVGEIEALAKRFLRIRWRGYSRHNSTASSYLLEYDVILWETGDISLHMVNIPTSYNDGVYSLVAGTTYSYSVSAASPDVTFYKTDSGFTVANELINLVLFDTRYLIRCAGKLYTTDGTEVPADLTRETLLEYGSYTQPVQEVLLTFVNPEVILWYDSDSEIPTLAATEIATPLPQTIYSGDYDLTDSTIKGVENAVVEADDSVLFAVSFDSGVTWQAYAGDAWVSLSESTSGMTATTMSGISVEAWAEAVGTAESFRLRATLTSLNSYVGSFTVNFIN